MMLHFINLTFSVRYKTLRFIGYLFRMALRPYRLLNSKRAFIRFMRNFNVCTHLNFTRENKIEAMYGRSRVNAKAEPNLTFQFTRDRFIFNSVHCLYFICARKFYSRIHVKIIRQWKPTLKISRATATWIIIVHAQPNNWISICNCTFS